MKFLKVNDNMDKIIDSFIKKRKTGILPDFNESYYGNRTYLISKRNLFNNNTFFGKFKRLFLRKFLL